MATSYQRTSRGKQQDEVQDALEACVQEGAMKMPVVAVDTHGQSPWVSTKRAGRKPQVDCSDIYP